MKKIFTLFATLLFAVTAMAEDYECNLAVFAYGTPSDYQKVNINCTKNANEKFDFLLKNFSFGTMNVGDINVKDIDVIEQNGDFYRFKTKQTIKIMFVLPCEIELEGTLNGSTLDVKLLIPSFSTSVLVNNNPKLETYPQVTGLKVFGTDVPNFDPSKNTGNGIVLPTTPTDADITFTTDDASAKTYVLSFHDTENKLFYVACYSNDLVGITNYVFDVVESSGVDAVMEPSCRTVIGRYNVGGKTSGNGSRGLVITKYSDGTVEKIVK